MMQKFEYTWASPNAGHGLIPDMNRLGEEGWRFVAWDEDCEFALMERTTQEVAIVQNITSGRCTSTLEPLKLGEGQVTAKAWCELTHGHKGAHRAINGTEWFE